MGLARGCLTISRLLVRLPGRRAFRGLSLSRPPPRSGLKLNQWLTSPLLTPATAGRPSLRPTATSRGAAAVAVAAGAAGVVVVVNARKVVKRLPGTTVVKARPATVATSMKSGMNGGATGLPPAA